MDEELLERAVKGTIRAWGKVREARNSAEEAMGAITDAQYWVCRELVQRGKYSSVVGCVRKLAEELEKE